MVRDTLKADVCEANLELWQQGLVTLTWGNVSGMDRVRGVMAIKPSGVAYHRLRPEHIVLVSLEGEVVEGDLRPSSDTAAHLALYRGFPAIGGIAHSHSRYATVFAQLRREIACQGTTHADHFRGPVPVTRQLSAEEVADDYEGHTGRVIVERFAALDPQALPGVLVAGHGPFTWGITAVQAVHNAIALEAVAEMAWRAALLDSAAPALEPYLVEKHYQRKHGPSAYYGQKASQPPTT